MPSWTGSFDGAPAGLLGPQLVVAEQIHRLGGRGLVVAGVVGQPGHRGERELLVLDPVASPDLHRVDADLDGELVHDALDGVRRLGPTGAPVRVGDRGVGEHAGALEAIGRELVDRVVHERAEQRHARSDQTEVGAHVREQVDAQPEHGAVAVRGDRDVLDLVAAVVRESRLSERVSVYLTGLPTRWAAKNASISSSVSCSLPPNPPPTSGAMTRIFCSGVPVSSAIRKRRMCGIWVADQIVNRSPDSRVDDDAARLHERRDQPLLPVAPLDDDLGVRERIVGEPPVPAAAESKIHV